jgi:hypothetical protein
MTFQCAIPVFEGLFQEEEDNKIMSELLFELVTWHGFAKLHLKTESNLHALDTSTTRLGRCIRRFKSKTCQRYKTRELPSEEAARGCHEVAAASKKDLKASKTGKVKASRRCLKKGFTLRTYKLHSLGDYVNAIRRYGTTDSYTTQTVCKSF